MQCFRLHYRTDRTGGELQMHHMDLWCENMSAAKCVASAMLARRATSPRVYAVYIGTPEEPVQFSRHTYPVGDEAGTMRPDPWKPCDSYGEE